MLDCKRFITKVKKVMRHPLRYYTKAPKNVFIDISGTGYVEYYYKYSLAQIESDAVSEPECVKIQLENMGFTKVGNSYMKVLSKRLVISVEPIGKSFTISIGYREKIRNMVLYCKKPIYVYKDEMVEKLIRKIEENGFNELLIAEKVRKLETKTFRGKKTRLKLKAPYYNVIYNVSKVTGINIELVPYLITLIP